MKAAGILFVAPSGKVLLARRAARAGQDADAQGCWSIPGGGIEEGEDAEQAARREIMEETGVEDAGRLSYWTRRVKDGVDFTTFLARCEDEFEPTLNDEHDAYQWTDKRFALTSSALHPGLYVSLRRFEMDELGVAKAIVAGELSSPQTYENLMLIALRITGTGGSYRPAHDEYVWRDPSLYMTQEFLERCNGLPVIFRHPEKTLLNTDEFRDRIVGSIFVPYMRPASAQNEADEVWGIAKVWDMQAGELLTHYEMSTSPAVLCLGRKVSTEDGQKLLVEHKPHLVDHLAILVPDPDPESGSDGAGVWDKGLGLSGVDSVDAQPVVLDDGPSDLDVIANAILSRKIDELCSR